MPNSPDRSNSLPQPVDPPNDQGWQAALAIALLSIFAWLVYRAKTQSISADEASSYLWFMDGPLFKVFEFYDVNNHMLFTLLARTCVHVLGPSEIALRLPTLAGAAIYLFSVHRLCRYALGTGFTAFVAGLLLSTNPIVQDYLVAARGYGLALGCFAAGFTLCTRALITGIQPVQPRFKVQCVMAGAMFACAVAASLTFIVPAAAATAAFAAAVCYRSEDRNELRRRLRFVILWFVVPTLGVEIFINWPFLIQLHRSLFANQGFGSFLEMSLECIRSSFFSQSLGTPGYTVPAAAVAAPWKVETAYWLGLILIPATVGLILLRFIWGVLRDLSRAGVFILSAPVLSVFVSILLNLALHMSYPPTRGSLYLIFLLGIGAMFATKTTIGTSPLGLPRVLCDSFACVIVLAWLLQFRSDSFRYSVYDANARTIFDSISKDAQVRFPTGVSYRVGGSWLNESSQNFYRRVRKVAAMLPYERKNEATPLDCDYFVFEPGEGWNCDASNYRILYRDPISGTVVVSTGRSTTQLSGLSNERGSPGATD